jgi:hypothetical protein
VGKDDWQDAERHLLTLPRPNVLTVWKKRASDNVVGADHLLEALSPEPRVTIQLSEDGHLYLVLRFFLPHRGLVRRTGDSPALPGLNVLNGVFA